jgi:hypothetical protein
MPSNTQLQTDMIPYNHNLYVQRLRTYLGDTAELNSLQEEIESTDVELYHYIQDTLDELNYEFLPQTSYTIDNFPSWNILQIGSILKYLTSKGILSARNTLTYQDGGGVTVQDYDKYGRYVNYFNVLINKFVRGATNLKLGKNVEDCYGGVSSEYGTISYDALNDW